MNHCRPPQNWSLECGAVQIAARQNSSQTTDGQYLIRFCKVLYRTLVIIVSEQFLLLGVHRYNRHPRRQGPLHLGVDMTELRVAVGMIRTFLRLPVAW